MVGWTGELGGVVESGGEVPRGRGRSTDQLRTTVNDTLGRVVTRLSRTFYVGYEW